MAKNQDLIKSITDKLAGKKKTEENKLETEVLVETETKAHELSATVHVAKDVIKVGNQFKIVEIEYDLVSKTGKIIHVSTLDNHIVGKRFELGREGLDSIVQRNKKHGVK
jgi:hypothetical protein